MRRMIAVAVLACALLGAWSGPARAQYFGKNKVQYKDFEWSVIQTEHFEVYFYEGEREAAIDASRMAERSYARLSHILRHRIKERVPLVLYASHADFQSTNIQEGFISEGTGGVTEFLKRRVYLPFTGSYAELEHVLTHELVHAFQVDIFWGGDQKNLLGNPFAWQPPLWIMEGSAEYLSQGGVDHITEMWLRDGALQGYLTPIPILNMVYDIRVYRYGQAVFEYVGRRYGPEKVGEILKRIAASHNTELAFRQVTGMTMEQLSEDWTEEVRRTYLPQVAEHTKPSTFAKQITDHRLEDASFNLAPAVSPDGDKVVFVTNRDLNDAIYMASTLDGKVLGRLVVGGGSGDLETLRFFYSSLDWSPDGRRVAFPAKSGGKDDINIYSSEDGRRVDRLRFDLDGIRSPSWSSDGTRIVFAGFHGGRSDLFVCDADGGNLRQLTDDRYSVMTPRFSPDDAQIVFTTDRGPDTDYAALHFGPQRMAIYDMETAVIDVLPNQPGNALCPHFSPDGKTLLFVGDWTGIANLYRYDLETGAVVRLTNILSGITGITVGSPPLSVSRNGKRLAFSAFSGGAWDIFVMKDPFEMAPFDTTVVRRAMTSSDIVRRATGLGELTRDLVSTVTRPDPPKPEVREGSVAADSLITVLVTPGGDTTRPVGDATPPSAASAPEPRPDEPPPAGEPVLGAAVPDSVAALFASREGMGGAGRPRSDQGINQLFGSDSLIVALDALPDTSTFTDLPFRSKFSADYGTAAAAVGGGIGVAGQAVVGFSDILGNKQIVVGAAVYGSITDADLYLSFTDRGKRINRGVALFQYRNDFLLSTASAADQYQSNIYRGGELTFHRPTDLFRRFELSVQGVHETERIFLSSGVVGGNNDLTITTGTHFYVVPSLAYVKDTALYGSTGPIKGTRMRLQLRQAVGGREFTEAVGDWRRYFNINQRYSFAIRALGATSFGPNPQIFRAGGPFTNRGVDYGQLEGSHMVLTNFEFRFPFIDYINLAFPLPMAFGGIRGVLFYDMGSAWGERYLIDDLNGADQNAQRTFKPWSDQGGFHLEDVAAAYGFGIRANLGFFLIRWDLARPTNIHHSTGKWKGYFALGTEF